MDVRASNVTVTAGDKTIVSGVDLHAHPGEITALIGPNGAGKSTLLGALSGDVELRGGSIHMGSIDVAKASSRDLARVRAVMLQDTNIAFSFLVRDVVEMGRRPWVGSDVSVDDATIVDAALRATNMTHLQAREAMTLSGGERARMALSRVLAQRAPVVLLDEPTAAMDIRHQEQSLGLIKRLAESGATVLVVLHDLNAAAAYADHIVCLSEGRVAFDGTVDEVYTSENLSAIYGWPIDVTRFKDGRVNVSPRREKQSAVGDSERGDESSGTGESSNPDALNVLMGGYELG